MCVGLSQSTTFLDSTPGGLGQASLAEVHYRRQNSVLCEQVRFMATEDFAEMLMFVESSKVRIFHASGNSSYQN